RQAGKEQHVADDGKADREWQPGASRRRPVEHRRRTPTRGVTDPGAHGDPPGDAGGHHRARDGSVTIPSFSMPERRTRSMVSTTNPYWSAWSALRYKVLSWRFLKRSRSACSREASGTGLSLM